MKIKKTWLAVVAVIILVIPQILAEDLRYAKNGVDPDATGYWWLQSEKNWWTNAQYSVGAPDAAHFPTKDDVIYINSPLLAESSKPLYIKEGDVIETKELWLNYGRAAWGSDGLWQYLDINGGKMTNYGNVKIGSGGGTGYGYAFANFRQGVWNVLGTLAVGDGVENKPMSQGVLHVGTGATLLVTNADFQVGSGKGFGYGVVTNEGYVSYKNLQLCPWGDTYPQEQALYVMRGGTNYNAACDSSAVDVLKIGSPVDRVSGVVRGWGYWDRGGDTGKNKGNIRMKMYGQVIADGEGVERDMNMGWFVGVNSGITTETNISGTNGWFAVNKGRLIYPHRAEQTGTTVSRTIGDERKNLAWDTPSDIINTVCLKGEMLSTDIGYGSWPWLQLYASDRSDIPDLAPVNPKHPHGRWLGVFRLGFFTKSDNSTINPTSGDRTFNKMSLKFRYDHIGLRANRSPQITLYRYDDTNGWIEQTSQIHNPDTPYISVEDLAPRTTSTTDKWNLGWFAIKADYEITGLILLFK